MGNDSTDVYGSGAIVWRLYCRTTAQPANYSNCRFLPYFSPTLCAFVSVQILYSDFKWKPLGKDIKYIKWHSGCGENPEHMLCSSPSHRWWHLFGRFVPNIVEEMITDWIINVQIRVRILLREVLWGKEVKNTFIQVQFSKVFREVVLAIGLFIVQDNIKGIVHPKWKFCHYYPLSCRSNPTGPLFIFGTQIKIFFMKSISFLTTTTFNAQKSSKDMVKIVHVTSVVKP